MANRWQLTVVALCTLLAAPLAQADIYRWDTGEVIPGTEGKEPGPGVDLSDMDLAYATLGDMDLTGANFEGANLSNANLSYSMLTGANLAETNLIDVNLRNSSLTVANLSEAVMTGAYLHRAHGFTGDQLYSTASYKQRDLRGVDLSYNDLTGWDLSEQDLTGVSLVNATLTKVNFAGAYIAAVSFYGATSWGFTKEQLYSTASYRQNELQGINLYTSDLTGWDFSEQDLTGAELYGATLTDTDLSGAVVTRTNLGNTTSSGFTIEQLSSTASYRAKNLQGIRLGNNDLAGWDFRDHDLGHAYFGSATLTGADLAGANLSDADLGGAILANANFAGAVVTGVDFRMFDASGHGVTKEQLYSTASYQNKDLRGIVLDDLYDLAGWDLSGQNLTDAHLFCALPEVNLIGANLKNAYPMGIQGAVVDATTVYNQWTFFDPFDPSFDPAAAGLTYEPSAEGDFNANDVLDVDDLEMLKEVVRGRSEFGMLWGYVARFQLNDDGRIDEEDYRDWVRDLKHTWFGDANLDGEFNSSDMVQVFAAGRYENGWLSRWGDVRGAGATWSEGDWNGDGIFDSSDMITAFADGGYEKGPRLEGAAVPEPASVLLLVTGSMAVVVRRRRL